MNTARRDDSDQPRVQIGASRERIDRLAAGQRDRDRVDREVPRRQVLLDRPGERREVDGPPAVERDPPGSVPLGERKRSATGAIRIRPRSSLRLADGDVEVDELASEELVPHRAADDPGLLAGEQLGRELTHRSPTRRARVGLELMRVESS